MSENLVLAIGKAVQGEADRLREEAIQAAVTQFEKQLRERVAQAAMAISEFYSVERDASNVIITVRHGANSKTGVRP